VTGEIGSPGPYWLSLSSVGVGGTDFPIGNLERSFDSLPSLRIHILIGCVVNHNREPYPLFFVSVASKQLSCDSRRTVNPLFATLAARAISVAAKGVKVRPESER